jgi:hypothetical protein
MTQPDGEYKYLQCAPGYHGNLCGNCRPGHGQTHPFFCRKCLPAAAIVVLYLLGVLVMIGLVKLLVYFQLSDTGDRADLTQPIPAEILRALTMHCQWLYIISTLVGVPWPIILVWPMQVIGGVWTSTSGSSIGIECILNHRDAVPIAIQKVLFCLFTPCGILCAVLVIEVVVRFLPGRALCCSKRGRGSPPRIGHDFAGVVMSIVFMFLPTWVKTALSLFTCVQLDTPVELPYQAAAVGIFWSEDMSQQCYSRTGYHRGWALGLGIPLTVVFCVALPAGVFAFMWYSRKQGKLGDKQFQKHYGFMFRLWRPEVCWYESVVLLQTVALVMVSTFGFALGSYYQALLSAAVLATVAVLLLSVRLYKCPAANKVAVLSVCGLFFTVYAALKFLPYNSVGPGPVYGNIMGVVIVLANVVFLARTIWKLMQVVDWAFVKRIVGRIGACCQCCKEPGSQVVGGGIVTNQT